jgi:alkanesulfonate monooxygenase SsuD/methylene tetrahydromethanopterin reductase-like flavin-dependent oxidoreductase (luciferase family)
VRQWLALRCKHIADRYDRRESLWDEHLVRYLGWYSNRARGEQQFINLRRGNPGQLQPPIDNIRSYCSLDEKEMVDHALMYSMVGSSETVRRGLKAFIAKTKVDELMVTGQIYDHAARLRSFEIAAEVRG